MHGRGFPSLSPIPKIVTLFPGRFIPFQRPVTWGKGRNTGGDKVTCIARMESQNTVGGTELRAKRGVRAVRDRGIARRRKVRPERRGWSLSRGFQGSLLYVVRFPVG